MSLRAVSNPPDGGPTTIPVPTSEGGTGTTTTFTEGSIVFAGPSGVYTEDNANLFWDDTNNRLGVGTATPSAPLEVAGNVRVSGGGTKSIAAVSGTSLNIGTLGAQNLQFVSNNTVNAILTSGGNVGIGTTSPTQKLEVSASSAATALTANNIIRVANTNAVNGGVTSGVALSRASTNGTMTDYAVVQMGSTDHTAGSEDAFLRFGTIKAGSMTEDVRIIGGNVGIGTTSPSTTLDVTGAAGAGITGTGNIAVTDNTAIATGTGGYLVFRGNYTSGGALTSAAGIKASKVNATSGEYGFDLDFYTRENGLGNFSNPKMRITSAGNVGIGTTGPDRKLDVLDASAPQLRLTYTDGSVYTDFQTNSSGTLAISPSGNSLTVNPDTDFSTYLGRAKIYSAVTDYMYVSHYDMANLTNYALKQNSAGSTVLNAAAGQNLTLGLNNASVLTLKGITNNIGIGTTGPDRKLDVLDASAPQLRLTYTDGSVYTDFQTDSSGKLIVTPTGNNMTLSGAGITTAYNKGIEFSGSVGFIKTIVANSLTYYLSNTYNNGHYFTSSAAITDTSGNDYLIQGINTFAPASGTATHTSLNLAPTINQTGGASGITRGLYITPALTAAADWRAIETTAGTVKLADTYAAGSGSLAGSLLDMTQTWNTTGTPTAIKLNVTDTASNASSLLMDLQVGGSSKFKVSKAGVVTTGGQLNVGGSVVATNLQASGASQIYWASRSSMTSPSSGVITFTDNLGSDFNRLQFGGTTSSFPALKRSSANLVARLADDSANTDLEVADEAYGSGWDGSLEVPTKNAVYDKIQSLPVGTGRNVSVISSPTTAGSSAYTDYVYFVSGTTTVTLPTAVGNSNLYTVKRIGTNTVTVDTTSAQTIDGDATQTLLTQYESMSFISDGANWGIV